jgi:dihydroorotate dehydrogenase (fumarate)
MADLSTTYLGLKLKNPVIVGSSTHTVSPARVQALAENGVGAVVLKSIFEEQIRADVANMVDALERETRTEAYDYLRADFPMQIGPETYLDRIREIKAITDIPVIASVNCVTPDRWVAFARKIEGAGADALELNIYDIADQDRLSSIDIEQRHLDLVKAIAAELTIPVAVKLAPFYTSLSNFARRLDGLGVAGMVLFNRFFQPDIDVEALALKSAVGLSHPDDIRLPLRWTAILSGRVACDIALTGGVHSSEGIVKALLAGATAVQVCSVLYKHDLSFVKTLVAGLAAWMDTHGFDTVDAFRGRLLQEGGEAGGFERAQYVRSLVGLE